MLGSLWTPQKIITVS